MNLTYLVALRSAVDIAIDSGNTTAACVYSRMLGRYVSDHLTMGPTPDADTARRIAVMTRLLMMNGWQHSRALSAAREILRPAD